MSFSLFLTIAAYSMVPITELRATIPIFLSRHPELPIWFILGAAVLGNMLPNFFLLWFFPRITTWLHDHLAPRINATVFWLHDFLIKGRRLQWLYLSILLITVLVNLFMMKAGVKHNIWYFTASIGIPLWCYICSKIAQKAYKSALEDKSIIHWFYKKVHKEHSKTFYRWGSLALVLVVGIPIPGTGSWTGSLLAFLFNIPFWKAVFLIFLGILMAASIITALSTGIISGLGLF